MEVKKGMAYALTDFEPFQKAQAKVQGLQGKLKEMEAGGGLERLAAKAQELEEAALNMETDALLDNKLQKKAKDVRNEADAAAQVLAEKRREAAALERALQQVAPELDEAREAARGKIIQQARKDHEKAVKDVLKALRQLSAACEAERQIFNSTIRAVGFTSQLANLAGTGFPFTPPGREDDPASPLHYILSGLRRLDYPV